MGWQRRALDFYDMLGPVWYAGQFYSKPLSKVELVLRRRLTVTGSTLRPRPLAFKAAIARSLRHVVWPLIESGRIKPVIHQVFPAAQAAQAQVVGVGHAARDAQVAERGAHAGRDLVRVEPCVHPLHHRGGRVSHLCGE